MNENENESFNRHIRRIRYKFTIILSSLNPLPEKKLKCMLLRFFFNLNKTSSSNIESLQKNFFKREVLVDVKLHHV